MFNQIFVSHLMQKETLTPEQTAEVLDLQKRTKIRIGVIAREEKLMTDEQVAEVNRLQASMNERFGDIAVKKGYITKEALEAMLVKQPREHLILKQILQDKGYLSSADFDSEMKAFRLKLEVTLEEFARLQDNDIEAYIIHIAGINPADVLLCTYAKIFITAALRLIDHEVYVQKAFKAKLRSVKYTTSQVYAGDKEQTLALISPSKESAKHFAETYAMRTFDSFDNELKHVFTDFLSAVNSHVIAELAKKGITELHVNPPVFHEKLEVKQEVTIMPFYLSMGEFCIFIMGGQL